MAALAKSQAYFSIGVPFERVWLKKIAAANPEMTIVATDEGIPKIHMHAHHHYDESHGHRNMASHEGEPDPHIWTSPRLVQQQVRIMIEALQKIDPHNSGQYQRNHQIAINLQATSLLLRSLIAPALLDAARRPVKLTIVSSRSS